MHALLAGLVVLVGASPLADRSYPGSAALVCLGDSNTYAFRTPPSWCSYLTDLAQHDGHPLEVRNVGIFGTTAISYGIEMGGRLLDGETQVQQAIAAQPKPTTAIVSLGSNDLVHQGATSAAVADRLLEIAAALRAAHMHVLVATIPPVGEPTDLHPSKRTWLMRLVAWWPWRLPTINERIAATNALLRRRLPAGDVVDFDHRPDTDYDPDGARIPLRDGIHINDTGQRARGALVWSALVERE